jgi:hypothetical protein
LTPCPCIERLGYFVFPVSIAPGTIVLPRGAGFSWSGQTTGNEIVLWENNGRPFRPCAQAAFYGNSNIGWSIYFNEVVNRYIIKGTLDGYMSVWNVFFYISGVRPCPVNSYGGMGACGTWEPIPGYQVNNLATGGTVTIEPA